jgi:quercetin dioxygenase-like cupin family protein
MEAWMSGTAVISIDTNRQPWERRDLDEIGASFFVKPLILDGETGMRVTKICYKAGFTNTSHWHNCAHGMYVLDGVLVTSAGNFGPGNFVWFPEGVTMFHGAQSDNDVTFLFFTNKAFDIHFTHIEGEKSEILDGRGA